MDRPFTLDNYAISSIVGRGTLGVVYKALDTRFQQFVAIKTIRKELLRVPAGAAPGPGFAGKSPAEVFRGTLLKHPNIVRVLEFGETPECYYLVMEFASGRSLAEHFADGRKFSLDTVRKILNQILEALDYAHSEGVIHGALSPRNVMVAETGQVQLSGFAYSSLSALRSSGVADFAIAEDACLAPELWRTGIKADHRADIFAAGLILYHLLTGQDPCPDRSSADGIPRRCTTVPSPPSNFASHLSDAYDNVTLRALQADPDERYQHAAEFAWILRNIKTPLHESRPARAAVRSQRFPVVLCGSIVGAASFAWMLSTRYAGQNIIEAGTPSVASDQKQTSAAEITAGLAQIAGKYSCLHIEAVPSAGNASGIRGFVAPDELERLRGNLAQIPSLTRLASDLRPLAWPYCELAGFLAPYKRGDKWDFVEDRNIRQYSDGDPLQLTFTVPDYAAHIYADYYQLDGRVVHLFPVSALQAVPQVPNSQITIGDINAGGPEWQIQPPFGTEMIVVMATDQPLFSEPRQEQEFARNYLAALRASLAGKNQYRLVVDYHLITTQAKDEQVSTP